ncbi:hypothetical protein SLS54_008994 [Diplodia seriata]
MSTGHCREHYLDLRERHLNDREAAIDARESTLNERESAAIKDLEARISARDAELTALHGSHARNIMSIRRTHAFETNRMHRDHTDRVHELQRMILDVERAAAIKEGQRDQARAKVTQLERMLRRSYGEKAKTIASGTRRKAADFDDDEIEGRDEEQAEERASKRVKLDVFRESGGADDESEDSSGSDYQAQGGAPVARGAGEAAEIGDKLDSLSLRGR